MTDPFLASAINSTRPDESELPPAVRPAEPNDPDETEAPKSIETSLARDAWRDLRRSPLFLVTAVIVVLILLIAIAPSWFAGWFGHGNPRACDLSQSNVGPRSGHPFGFDTQGCDEYANVIYGARDSLSVGLLVSALCLIVAVVLGSVSGFYGRAVDAVISRVSDVFFGFPFLLGALVLLTSLQQRTVLTLSLVLAFLAWPFATRIMRASILQVVQSNYITASRALGATSIRLMLRHILPNAIAPLIVVSATNLGGFIVAGAALTFLGIGLQDPAISWGAQLANAQENFNTYPHLIVFPAVFLSVTVLSFILLGDIMRDAFDPKLRSA